jgi:hypothetical protein
LPGIAFTPKEGTHVKFAGPVVGEPAADGKKQVSGTTVGRNDSEGNVLRRLAKDAFLLAPTSVTPQDCTRSLERRVRYDGLVVMVEVSVFQEVELSRSLPSDRYRLTDTF